MSVFFLGWVLVTLLVFIILLIWVIDLNGIYVWLRLFGCFGGLGVVVWC